MSDPSSSSAPVVGLSGFIGGSLLGSAGFSFSFPGATVIWLSLLAVCDTSPIAWSSLGSTAGVAGALFNAPSGMVSMFGLEERRICSSCRSCFISAMALLSFGSVLKLSLRAAMELSRPADGEAMSAASGLGNCGGSTATKLALTFDNGLPLASKLLSLPAAGDRPRPSTVSGASAAVLALFSKMLRRLRTAEWERSEDDMAVGGERGF